MGPSHVYFEKGRDTHSNLSGAVKVSPAWDGALLVPGVRHGPGGRVHSSRALSGSCFQAVPTVSPLPDSPPPPPTQGRWLVQSGVCVTNPDLYLSALQGGNHRSHISAMERVWNLEAGLILNLATPSCVTSGTSLSEPVLSRVKLPESDRVP